jgi:hypothetical protein
MKRVLPILIALFALAACGESSQRIVTPIGEILTSPQKIEAL